MTYQGSCGNLCFVKLFHSRDGHIFFLRLPVPPAAANLSRNAVGGWRPSKTSPLRLASGVWSAREDHDGAARLGVESRACSTLS
jgi:hypothetical protein